MDAYTVLNPGDSTKAGPWVGVQPGKAVEHLVTLLRCRAYRDRSCEPRPVHGCHRPHLEALYRQSMFRRPANTQGSTDYAARYADILDRFLCRHDNPDRQTVDGSTVFWLYDRIMPDKDLPWPGGGRPSAGRPPARPHCVYLPGAGYMSWFVSLATPGRYVSCLAVDGSLRRHVVPDSRRGVWNPVSGTLEYHYWDDRSVKDLIRRLMLLRSSRNEDGVRVLSKESRATVQNILTEEVLRLARIMRSKSLMPLLLPDGSQRSDPL